MRSAAETTPAPAARRSASASSRWAVLLLVLVSVAVFAEVAHHEFVVWDDDVNVFTNPYLQPVTLDSVLHFWREPYFSMYAPVTRTVWAGIARLSSPAASMGESALMSPRPFHLANLAVHVLNVVLVFAILRLLVHRDWPACAGAMLFALHPVQVEPVAWVTGMKDLLGGLFSLLALWGYLSYASAARDQPREGRGRTRYALATVSYVLALLSKPSAVALPVMAWVLGRWALKRPAREVTLALIPWVLLVVPCIAVTRWAEQQPAGQAVLCAVWARPIVAGDAIAFYLYKLVFPLHLAPDYGRTPEFVLRHTWGYVTWLVPCVVGALIWLRRRSWGLLATAAGVLVAGLLPVLGLMQFSYQEHSTVADRYLYLAMLGPALGMGWLLTVHRGRAVRVICVLALALLAFQSAFQTLRWHSTTTLFEHALTVNRDSWVAHTLIGEACSMRGNWRQAISHFLAALGIRPDALPPRMKLGNALVVLGKADEAALQFREALRLHPDSPEVHDSLAVALDAQGLTEEARAHWAEALRLDPRYAWGHYNLGVSLARDGQTEQAALHWREALRIMPRLDEARRALARARRGQGAVERPQ